MDVTDFFGSLDHTQLKAAWASLIQQQRLPDDHFAVFKAITRYCQVERDALFDAIHTSVGSVRVSWSYPEDADSYQILEKSTDESEYRHGENVPGATKTAVRTGLTAGKAMQFVVVPTKNSVSGARSEPSSPVVLPSIPVPTITNVARSSSTSLRTWWSYSGPTAERYEIWQRINSGALTFGENVAGNVLTAERTDLTPNSMVEVMIRAVVDGQVGSFSAPKNVLVSLQSPTSVVASGVSVGVVQVSWQYEDSADSYRLLQKLDGESAFTLGENVPGSTRTALRTGLPAGVGAEFVVQAVKNGVVSAASGASARVVVPAVPVPHITSVTRTSGTSFRINYGYSGPAVERFELWYQANGGALTFGENIPPTAFSAERTGLATNVTYTPFLRAIVSGQAGAFAVGPGVLVRVDPPSSVTASATATAGAIKISWRNDAGAVEKFVIYQRLEGTSNWVFGENVPADRLNATRDGLSRGKRYYFKVVRVVGGVASPLSDTEGSAVAR